MCDQAELFDKHNTELEYVASYVPTHGRDGKWHCKCDILMTISIPTPILDALSGVEDDDGIRPLYSRSDADP